MTVGVRHWGARIWRFPLVRLLIGVAAVALTAGISSQVMALLSDVLFADRQGPPWYWVVSALVVSGASLGAYGLYVRLVEQRPAVEIALAGALSETLWGIVSGAGLISLTIGTLWLVGSYQIIRFNGFAELWQPLATHINAGVIEEILFRALLFRLLEKWLGSWMSLAISALFFGFAHAANPGATIFANMAIALEAGLLLGAVYMYTGRLWLAIGLHFAWNFVQGGIFGVAVSGTVQSSLLEANLRGPELIAGGDFGAEASIFAVIYCLALTFILLRQERVNFIPAPWQRRKPRSK